MMCKIRGEYQSHPRPQWISEEIMQQLIQQWEQDDYKERRDKARRNRASSIRGTLHTGGSILTSEHIDWSVKAVGGKNKKGRIFGIGSEACEIGTSSPYSVLPSDLHLDFEEELQRRMKPVIDELRAQKEEINTQKEKIDAQATIINDMGSMVDRFINSVDRRLDTPTVDDDDETQPPDHPLD